MTSLFGCFALKQNKNVQIKQEILRRIFRFT